jgi:hypothetical protein
LLPSPAPKTVGVEQLGYSILCMHLPTMEREKMKLRKQQCGKGTQQCE